MPLAERLSADFRVVTLEYFGYGFSDRTPAKRTNAAIAAEMREALKKLEIAPPYIFMPHSLSGVYCLSYALRYPDEVQTIIGIDESKPNQAKSGPIFKKKTHLIPSSMSFINSMGIFRALLSVLPEFSSEYKNNKFYSVEQWQLIKAATAWNLYNGNVVNEANSIYPNCAELFDVKYPASLPILSLLAQGSVDNFKKMIDKKEFAEDWVALHQAVISNPAIQKMEVLDGKHYLHHTHSDQIVAMTKEFVAAHCKP
jgi:pimeloyl-ACP methyl ester carboxylesterase